MATEILLLYDLHRVTQDIGGFFERMELGGYYAKWSGLRQARISELLARLWHSKKSGPEVVDNAAGNLVDGVGLEPTTPALRTRCSPN